MIHFPNLIIRVGLTIPTSPIGLIKTNVMIICFLESLLENFVEAQTKKNEYVEVDINDLTSKVDILVIYSKIL